MTISRRRPDALRPVSGAEEAPVRRQAWMAVLARASAQDLQSVLATVEPPPSYTVVRGPEVGAVMLGGRAGGTGARFNLGEATVTRCTVRLEDGTAGVSYALGRDVRRAVAAAVIDALLQREGERGALYERAVVPLARAQREARDLASRKAAATKVDFFTLVRGA